MAAKKHHPKPRKKESTGTSAVQRRALKPTPPVSPAPSTIQSGRIPAGLIAEVESEKNSFTHRWTFLTNHSHVLVLLSRDPSMVLREVAIRVGITERAVQRIIADLEHEGFIERERVGRQNRYQVHPHLRLRHPIESHRTIGELLKAINP